MAKQKNRGGELRCAVNKQALKNARAKAALEQARLAERVEKREKSRRMSSVFLWSVASAMGLFCLYTALRVLCFPKAASLEELRGNLLFFSVAALPYLLGFGAVLVHRLLKKRRESWSDRTRRLGTGLMVLILVLSFALFGVQLRGSRRDASGDPACVSTLAALRESGLPVSVPAEIYGARTLLESALVTELRCGECAVRLNSHSGSGWIAARFLSQAAADYAECQRTEDGAVTRWGPGEADGTARAALAKAEGNAVTILELVGPQAELDTLLPLLAAALN